MSSALMTGVGRLTRTPEMRYTAGGDAVISLNTAFSKSFKDKAGEEKETTTWIEIPFWRDQAEKIANRNYQKGDLIWYQGEPEIRLYKSDKGQFGPEFGVGVTLTLKWAQVRKEGGQKAEGDYRAAEEPSSAGNGAAKVETEDVPF